MGLFNQFPFTNFHEMNLDWIIGKIKEIETRLQDSPYNPTIHTRPEDFGALGDGLTDDTIALQKCVNYAQSSGKMVVSDSSKKYLVTNTIDITGPIFINLNFATITTNNMFNGSLFNFNDNFGSSDICRIRVNGVYQKCTFMNIDSIHHSEIHDLIILNVNNGFKVVNGYEAIISNAIIFNGAGTHGNIAIEHNTWDCSYNHIYAVNFNTVFKMGGGNNRINDCHCWNTDLQTYSGTTIFADILEEYNIFSRCTSDTFHITFNNQNTKALFINDLLFYSDGKTSCRIFDGYNEKTIINGFYGNGKGVTAFSNGVFRGSMNNVFLENFTDCKSRRYILPCSLSEGFTGALECYTEDSILHIYGNIHGAVVANTAISVAQMPTGFASLVYTGTPISSDDGDFAEMFFSTDGSISIKSETSATRTFYVCAAIPLYRAT